MLCSAHKMKNLLLLLAGFVLLAHAEPDFAAAGQQYAQCSALILDLNDLTFCNSTWRTEIPHLFLKQQLGSEGWWNWVDRQRYLEPDYILNQTVYESLMWTWHNLGLREVSTPRPETMIRSCGCAHQSCTLPCDSVACSRMARNLQGALALPWWC